MWAHISLPGFGLIGAQSGGCVGLTGYFSQRARTGTFESYFAACLVGRPTGAGHDSVQRSVSRMALPSRGQFAPSPCASASAFVLAARIQQTRSASANHSGARATG